GNVRWRLAIPIGIAGIAGAVMGAQIALRLDPDLLRRMFGVFLLILAVRMAWRAWRMNGRTTPEPEPS
ncbi:MAG: TSUP family transporter, partial [Acidimicrobiia bacterium]